MTKSENELLDYFNGDTLAVDVWKSKYQLKDPQGKALEATPKDMHRRLAKEFARKEFENLIRDPEDLTNLSKFGKSLQDKLLDLNKSEFENLFFSYFDQFKWIVPQGSIMSILGNPFKIGSLSNCFTIEAPQDSYGGILRADQELVQLMKRRGGVGTHLNTLRPSKTFVSNAAGTSTGPVSFAERYSNSTREVAQDGRRGALILLLSCLHPDIFQFATMKKDRTKVTGANVSVMLTDKFMQAVEKDEDFICRFPIDMKVDDVVQDIAYNKLTEVFNGKYIMKIHAKELFDLVVEMAWENGDPGTAFMDRIVNYCPEGVYEQYKPRVPNPCGRVCLK